MATSRCVLALQAFLLVALRVQALTAAGPKVPRQDPKSECSICMDGTLEGKTCSMCPICDNAFHSDCLGKWLKDQHVCPLSKCRLSPGQAEEFKVRNGEWSLVPRPVALFPPPGVAPQGLVQTGVQQLHFVGWGALGYVLVLFTQLWYLAEASNQFAMGLKAVVNGVLLFFAVLAEIFGDRPDDDLWSDGDSGMLSLSISPAVVTGFVFAGFYFLHPTSPFAALGSRNDLGAGDYVGVLLCVCTVLLGSGVFSLLSPIQLLSGVFSLLNTIQL